MEQAVPAFSPVGVELQVDLSARARVLELRAGARRAEIRRAARLFAGGYGADIDETPDDPLPPLWGKDGMGGPSDVARALSRLREDGVTAPELAARLAGRVAALADGEPSVEESEERMGEVLSGAALLALMSHPGADPARDLAGLSVVPLLAGTWDGRSPTENTSRLKALLNRTYGRVLAAARRLAGGRDRLARTFDDGGSAAVDISALFEEEPAPESLAALRSGLAEAKAAWAARADPARGRLGLMVKQAGVSRDRALAALTEFLGKEEAADPAGLPRLLRVSGGAVRLLLAGEHPALARAGAKGVRLVARAVRALLGGRTDFYMLSKDDLLLERGEAGTVSVILMYMGGLMEDVSGGIEETYEKWEAVDVKA